MEALKTKRVLEAKENMQEKKKKVQEEKTRLLEDAKNRFAQNRPGGTDSIIGDNFIDFMSSSPRNLKITKSRAGFSVSLKNSPKGSNTSPLLKVQEMLKLQNQDSDSM